MITLFLLFALIANVLAGHHNQHDDTSAECEGCVKLPPDDNPDLPKGACCYGSKEIKCTTQADCEVDGFWWAGPYTDASACRHQKPCCYQNNGTCTNTVCFDCVFNGGVPVDNCNECEMTTTTTHTTKTKHTKTTKTHTSTPTPTPDIPNFGCCCFADGSEPEQIASDECHSRNGIYRGDGTTCDTENICIVKCCDTATNQCVDGMETKAQCEAVETQVFHGLGDCDEATCGGSCCVNGHAVLAFSENDCCERGGIFKGFGIPLNDDDCPRACCIPDDPKPRCEMKTPEECSNENGTPFLAGDTCRTIKCSGACCYDVVNSDSSDSVTDSETTASVSFGPSTCSILPNSPSEPAESACNSNGGVYQGDGSHCPTKIDVDGTDSSSDTESSSSSSSSSSSTDKQLMKRVVEVEDSATPTEVSTTDDYSNSQLYQENGQCLNDGACCLRDIDQGDENGCIRTGTIAMCVAKNGTFQGIGTRCSDFQICKKSACCLGTNGGCIDVHIGGAGEVECRSRNGRYVGDGTTCRLPGMCDKGSGACCCDGQCLNMPNATTCYDYGGCSFRGTGTDCCHEGMCEKHVKHEGACCIQNSYLEDGAQCVVLPSASACAFRGGVWRGKDTNCDNADFTCGPLTGVCCVDGIAYDDQTASECKKCGGEFAGPGTCSGDEGVCDKNHRGACCKKGHGCEDTTYTQCKRMGGNFQGPGSKCQDDVCTPCLPCSIEAQACSFDEDCPEEMVCVAQFGKCMVPAMRIKEKRIWNPMSHARAMRLKTVPPAKPFVAKIKAKPLATHHDGDRHEYENKHDDDDTPDGPFSCGSNATIGFPCIIHPGCKCAVGTCGVPPPNTVSSACESLCMNIHEYDCDCECRDPWWETCAFIAGATYKDTNADNALETEVDQLYTDTAFTVNLFSIPEGGDSEVLVATDVSTDGRFSFPGLAGGTYRVTLVVPDGYRIEDGNGPDQLAAVECLPAGDEPSPNLKSQISNEKTIRSQVLTIINSKALSSHIKDNVNFLIDVGVAESIVQEPDVSPDLNALSSSSATTIVITIIVVAVIVLCLIAIAYLFYNGRRMYIADVRARTPQRTVNTKSTLQLFK